MNGIICFEKHRCGNYPDKCNTCSSNWKNAENWKDESTKTTEIGIDPVSEAIQSMAMDDVPKDFGKQVKELFSIYFRNIIEEAGKEVDTDPKSLEKKLDIIKEELKKRNHVREK